jgi:hypothetical protein
VLHGITDATSYVFTATQRISFKLYTARVSGVSGQLCFGNTHILRARIIIQIYKQLYLLVNLDHPEHQEVVLWIIRLSGNGTAGSLGQVDL